MHLKMHQNVSASESNQDHLHTLANFQLSEFTWQPQFKVQMKELGESQAKSCGSQLDVEEILQAEVSIHWRKLTGNTLMGTAY